MSIYTWFEGNVDFYNDIKYRKACQLMSQAFDLLKECGMTENQAYLWYKHWMFHPGSE